MLTSKISADYAILALMRKRSGDLFRGELTRMMKETGTFLILSSMKVWWRKR